MDKGEPESNGSFTDEMVQIVCNVEEQLEKVEHYGIICRSRVIPDLKAQGYYPKLHVFL